MSRYFSTKYKNLEPYTPGEQPRDMKYIKLNTNESPFAPSKLAVEYAKEAVESYQLYSDPECTLLVEAASKLFGVEKNEILFTNGSDEILNFAFMAYCDGGRPAHFPDITYGFYSVFAEINNVPFEEIPLTDSLTIDITEYFNKNGVIFITNPNAPTGIALPLCDIERIVQSNPDGIVVIDEAYVDFGADSAISLIKKYDNLIVTGTFSKSRSMAGARLGFGIACPSLIADLNAIKYSTNPYNVNRATMAAGLGAILDDDYTKDNCKKIIQTRERTAKELRDIGFEMTSSSANFIFAKHKDIDGEKLYLELKKKGILVRHFKKPRLCDYNRITVGTDEQMDTFVSAVKEILGENRK